LHSSFIIEVACNSLSSLFCSGYSRSALVRVQPKSPIIRSMLVMVPLLLISALAKAWHHLAMYPSTLPGEGSIASDNDEAFPPPVSISKGVDDRLIVGVNGVALVLGFISVRLLSAQSKRSQQRRYSYTLICTRATKTLRHKRNTWLSTSVAFPDMPTTVSLT
jgi:hypothetical protein